MKGVFYGWWIVASTFIINTLSAGLYYSGFGAYFVPIQEQLHWSKTVLSGAFSMSRLESGFMGPVEGWLVEKFGPRAVVRAGVIALGVGFMLFSQVHSIPVFYLTFLLMALGASFAGHLALSTSIINWFEKKRATAMGISSTGLGVGGLLVPAVAWLIGTLGWRTTALVSGVAIILLSLPVTSLIRFRPEEHGYLPDGAKRPGASTGDKPIVASPTAKLASGGETEESHPSLSWKQALKTPAFWFISLGHGFSLFAVSTLTLHLIPYSVDTLGISVQAAASVVAVLTTLQLVGQFSGGFITDRLSQKAAIVVCMLGHAGALLGLAFATNLGLVMLYASIHGLAWGVRGPLMSTIRAEYFGRKSYATIMGFSSLLVMIGPILGPLIAGYSADRFGSYRVGFLIIAGLVAIGGLFFMAAQKPTLPPQAAEMRVRAAR